MAEHPQADNVTLVAFADALAEFYVLTPERVWKECVKDALGLAGRLLANAAGAGSKAPTSKRSNSWPSGRRAAASTSTSAPRATGRSTGARASATMTARASSGSSFRALWAKPWTTREYNRTKTLLHMAEEGLLVTGGDRRHTRQKRFDSGTRVYCVYIGNDALDAFLDRPAPHAGDASSGSVSH